MESTLSFINLRLSRKMWQLSIGLTVCWMGLLKLENMNTVINFTERPDVFESELDLVDLKAKDFHPANVSKRVKLLYSLD